MLSFVQFIAEGTYGGLDVAKDIIQKLRNGGFQSYICGGAVRDFCLGVKPKDYDVATDAHPDQVQKLFPHSDAVGAHFGVIIHKGIEIATFRSDGAYSDSRRPDTVQYETSPKEDAARRDFTCNSLYMDPFTGHILDFFGGREDIKHKILRAVGDPYKRFGEDRLRMLRAMRFAAKLGFTIEPNTLAAMKGLAPDIKSVAPERISQEITGALSFPGGPAKSLAILHHTGMLAHILPEVDSLPAAQFDLMTAILEHVHHESATFALAAIFCQLTLNIVRGITSRLKLSGDESRHILGVLELQPRITEASAHLTMDVLKKLMRNPFFPDALKLYGYRVQAHDSHAHPEPFHFLQNLFSGMKHEDLHPERFVTGTDLITLGKTPGKEFKEILDKIEIGQLTGQIQSRAQAIELIRSGRL